MRRLGLLVLGIWGLLAVNPVSAVPVLSLDVSGGTYNDGSIMATSDSFSLYALFNTQNATASGTYYIAAAIVPKTQNPPTSSFGSFTINGVTYSAANMSYGNPPASITDSSADLQSHGIYDTHYVEIGFTFDLNNRATLYNSQDNPGGFVEDASGAMLFEEFDIDVTGLAPTYEVHFDLYKIGTDKRGNPVVQEFAPFTHDAQSGPVPVSDASSTMILLGMAMLAVEGMRRRFLR